MESLDRIKERSTLRKTFDLSREVLVMIYGRRRMGKSEPIKKVLTSSDIYHVSEEAQLQQQIDSFAETILYTLKFLTGILCFYTEDIIETIGMNKGGLIYIVFFSQY